MNEVLLRNKIVNLESLIAVYSEIDNVRTKELQAQLTEVEQDLLILMTEFNNEWLLSIKQSV